MSVLDYPVGLPFPDLNTQGFAVDGGLQVTEMEGGSARGRQLYTNLPTRWTGTLTLGRAHGTVLLAFFQKAGGQFFNVNAVLPFMLGPQPQQVQAMFLAAPTPVEVGLKRGAWALQLRIRALALPDVDDLDFLAVYGDDAPAAIDAYAAISADLSTQLGGL